MIIDLKASTQRKIWGGSKLETLKNIKHDPNAVEGIGETWEISIHKDGPSFVGEQKLNQILEEEELTYLVKLIDTSDDLSIQVHPGDEYASRYENSLGKTECWIILEAEEKSGIYLGFKAGVTKERFQKAIEDKEKINEYLNFYEVKKGDFFYVPAGSIHAIGSGITLAEVQQNSGITYRVWDWDRVDSKGNPRELHVKKSLDVLNFEPELNTLSYFRVKKDLFKGSRMAKLLEHETFELSLVNLKAGESIELGIKDQTRLSSILNLEGQLKIDEHEVGSYQSVLFREHKKAVVKALRDSSFLFVE